MNIKQLHISRRAVFVIAVLVGITSLAIGARAALNKGFLVASKATPSERSDVAARQASRIALVVGNGHYLDADSPLTQPISDARALTAVLRGDGFDVDVIEDAKKDDMSRAINRMRSKIKLDSVVMLFFSGYGIRVGDENYLIPVDAAIWKEADVRRDGFSIETMLDAVRGARAKVVVFDASRRNPYERRFRVFSHGLAPINAPDNALILSSAAPGTVADDSENRYSVLMTELLKNLDGQAMSFQSVFNKTQLAISRASAGEQVPSLSLSLLEDVQLTPNADTSTKEVVR